MAAVSSTSNDSLNLQFEDIAEKYFVHMNLTTEELQIFKLRDRKLDGKYYRVDFQTEGNTYMAARAQGAFQPGYDPSASAEDGFAPYTVNQMKFFHRHVYISTDFTGPMQSAIKSRKGGYKNLVTFRFDDTLQMMKERVGIKLAGTQLGTIAKIQDPDVVGGGDNTEVRVRYAGHHVAGGSPESGIRYIRAGLRLDAATASRTGALRTGVNDRGRKVNAVELDLGTDAAGPKITLNSAHTGWAAGDFLVTYNERQTGAISTANDYENGLYGPQGILDLIDDSDFSSFYGGLSRTTFPTLQAQVLDNSGTLRRLDQQLINFGYNRLEQISGGKPDVFYSTFGVQRRFVDFLTVTGATTTANDNPMRFNQPGSTAKIGFNSYEVFPLGAKGQLMFMPSRLAPQHSGFLLQRDTAVLLQDGPPGFIDYDGNTIRKVTGVDEATADWKWRVTGMVGREPWKNLRFDDLLGDHLNQ